jgi:4Fe-4S ferredoxin
VTFSLVVEKDNCTGCGNCVVACPINALKVDEAYGGKGGGVELKIENGITCVLTDACNGCGVCVVACSQRAITLRALTPSQAKRELRISEMGSGSGEQNGVLKEEYDPEEVVRFKIDPVKKALLESVLGALKNIKVRYLIETGKAEDAKESILKRKDAGKGK